ncbi:Olfactory receptor, insect [Cinara cedri]|uniref:Olfactory receptor, insect n=1 Tax=Cinara cedri TaxID=506608 RepID=A0A5E4NP60_9HEMI|nr:Olfactory receptor, insect [Cinara cedri]
MLDVSKAENYVLSPVLAKYTGLYHIINPDCPRLGGLNISHLMAAVSVAFTVTCLACCPIGFYHWANDTTQLVLQMTAFTNFLLGCYKTVTIVRHSDDIRTLLDVTRIDFVSTDRQSFRALRECRAVSSTFIVWFAAFNYCVLLAWTLLPMVVNDKHVWVKNRDGTFSSYQLNPFNMFFLVSSDTYNRWHIAFHVVELLLGLCFALSLILFDTFMVIMCFSVTSQLKLIADSYENLGHAEIYDHGSGKKNAKACSKDLKSIIKKHQKVMG